MAGASSATTICDQIRPFSGSQGLSRLEIETFIDGRLATNLKNPKFRSEFGKFALLGHKTTRPPSYNSLKCFELCDQVQNDNYMADEETINEIKNYCQTCEMEDSLISEDLSNAIDTIMISCRERIESSKEFARFKKKLQAKVKPKT